MLKFISVSVLTLVVLVLSGCNNSPSISKLPDKFINDKEALGNSIKKFGEASDITNGSDRNATDEKTKKVLSLTAESIENSQKVSDEFLDYLSPDLKRQYHEKFIKSQQLYYEGLSQVKDTDALDSESVKKQIEASNLMKEWLAWWKSNNEDVLDKVFAE